LTPKPNDEITENEAFIAGDCARLAVNEIGVVRHHTRAVSWQA